MLSRGLAMLLLLVSASLPGCAQRPAATASPPPSAGSWPRSGDPGLEVVAWSTDADEAVFARALLPYENQAAAPGGLSPESVAFLASHGLRIFAVPVIELESLRLALGAPPRNVNQWLGQAVVWTEAISGPDQLRGQTIALESERLRLGPGRLRLLARSWISPAPPLPIDSAPSTPGAARAASGAMMTIELLPQHDEEGRVASNNPFLAPKSIAATEEGLLFTRLLTRMAVRSSDTAFVLVGFPPGVDLARAAESQPDRSELRAITDGEAGGAPGVGQVVRQPSGEQGSAAGPTVAYETHSSAAMPDSGPGGAVGPAAARLPTLGEAILSPHVWVTPRRAPGRQDPDADTRPVQTTPRRMVVAFVPRLAERVRLLP